MNTRLTTLTPQPFNTPGSTGAFNRRHFVNRVIAAMAAANVLTLALTAFAGGPPDGVRDAFGPLYQAAPHLDASPRHGPRKGLDSVRRWNQIAIDASGLDHTPVATGENRVFGEQFGPCRASRAMAIVHIAMFDTVNSVVGEYESYTGLRAPSGPLSVQAAISQAAHDTLAARFNSFLAEDLAAIKNKYAKANSLQNKLGKIVCLG